MVGVHSTHATRWNGAPTPFVRAGGSEVQITPKTGVLAHVRDSSHPSWPDRGN